MSDAKRPRIAWESLHSCSGCEITLLDTGTTLLDLLSGLNLVHLPLLMDSKYCAPESDETLTIPEADIGLVSGGVANMEHLQVLLEMRKKCTTLVALGTCATHGGIPALLNGWPLKEGMKAVFSTETTEPCKIPDKTVPGFLERVYALDEKVEIDFLLPGCPPQPGMIQAVLEALVNQQHPKIATRSVCDTCPAERRGKADVFKINRFLVNAGYDYDAPLATMRCLLEQGFLCMGPVTAAGCAYGEEAPGCIRARVPCRGCFGPVRHGGNQLLDMLNALVSNSVEYKSMPDRRSLLRFCGAHGLLRPLNRN